jgi:hypothetical protein
LDGSQTDGKPVASSRRRLSSALGVNWPLTTKQLSHAPPLRLQSAPPGGAGSTTSAVSAKNLQRNYS